MLGGNLWGPPGPAAASDFAHFSEILDRAAFETMEQRTAQMIKDGLVAKLEGADTAALIADAIQSRTPSSFIRFSDGEGNLMPLVYGCHVGPALRDYCLERISYIHFGDTKVIPRYPEFFAAIIDRAARESTLLGLPSVATITASFERADEDKDVRGIVGNRCAFAVRWQLVRDRQISRFADIWFNVELQPFYRQLLTGLPQLGLVSSYPELAPLLQSAFDIASVDFVPVPGQAVFTATRLRRDTQHYPDAFAAIVDQLRPRQTGMVYLVAAGLLGKEYCSIVKERGGIAIDIGSVAELWLGIPARGRSKEYTDRWILAPDASASPAGSGHENGGAV